MVGLGMGEGQEIVSEVVGAGRLGSIKWVIG